MSVALVATGAPVAAAAGVGTMTIPAPTGSGGLLVAWAGNLGGAFFNTPAGWALLNQNSVSAGPSGGLYWRASDGSAADTPAWTPTTGTFAQSGIMVRLSGSNLTGPFDPVCTVLNSQPVATGGGSISSFTPQTAGCYQVVGLSFSAALSTVTWPTPPAGLGGTGSGCPISILGATRSNTSSGVQNWTCTPNVKSVSVSGVVWVNPPISPMAYMHLQRQRRTR